MPTSTREPLCPRAALAALVVALLVVSTVHAYGDYDDDESDFWKDKPPAKPVKTSVDPKTGQRLVATTIRFFHIRLKPSRKRTMADAVRVAEELNDVFFQEGLSANKANPVGPHLVSVQVREEWEELKDIIFSVDDVADVMVKEQLYSRPPPAGSKPGKATPSYSELWRAEMGEDELEPLADQLIPRGAPPAPQGMDAGKKKSKGKGKEKKGKSGAKGTKAEGGVEL
ncbi:hypothetical protein HYH02_009727 [Chlamydomonas schloesseri]|uniref:Uncharacterized protein n=1 Tax=Chlamydomonas schloesseri TaxID=2026947 RepID=A0A835W8Y0_9CHLO|nr:hypothetical protein HYH02_009727 [Chlamydomonas schloesseri]|eukprot:KAG2442243.1 hypothetical protein HYH02_009727 [Chlamydomonas schloesseri]